MNRHRITTTLALSLIAMLLLAGCGSTTPTPSSSPGTTSTTPSPSSTPSSSTPSSSLSTQPVSPTVVVHNAAPTQLEAWAQEHVLYVLGPHSAYATNPSGTIFLLPQAFQIPTTLHHWPSKRFAMVAVMNRPQTQIGTQTGTLWNQMTTSIYWLKPASSQILPKTITASTSSMAVLSVPSSQLFAVSWPDAAHPGRVLFLEPRTFSMPTIVHHWPSHNFRVVAVYPSQAIQWMGYLPELVRSVFESSRINARARAASLVALPPSFSSYSDVRQTVGHRLAQTSDVPVYLPQDILSGTYHGPMDVRYSVHKGTYTITIGAGPALPANSSRINFGNAGLFGTIKGMAWTPAFHARQRYMPLYPTTSTSSTTHKLGSGVTAIFYPGGASAGPVITWHQDGWTFNIIGFVGTSPRLISHQASSISSSLGGVTLPGTHGRATFAFGSDSPSEATYDVNGTRYFIYANGFRVVALVRHMTIVQP